VPLVAPQAQRRGLYWLKSTSLRNLFQVGISVNWSWSNRVPAP